MIQPTASVTSTTTMTRRCSSRKRRREEPPSIEKKSTRKSVTSREKLCLDRASSPSAPKPLISLVDEEEVQPSNDNGSAQSIFTHSFAPMLLYSSMPEDNNKKTTVTSSSTEPKDSLCAMKKADILMSSALSSSTSQSSEASLYKADLNAFLPPLPITITCPSPASYPPAPRLPPLRSHPKEPDHPISNSQSLFDSRSGTQAHNSIYCPSLFDRFLPRLPQEYRLEHREHLYSVDLHGRIMESNSSDDRKQTSQVEHGQQSISSFTHQQQDHQLPYSLRQRVSGGYRTCADPHKKSIVRPALLTSHNADINLDHQQHLIIMPRAVYHGNRARRAQRTSSTGRRRLSSRSLGDMPQSSTGDFGAPSSDVTDQGHQDALMTPIEYGSNGGGPIRSARLRAVRRNTMPSYTFTRPAAPSPPSASRAGRNGSSHKDEVKTRARIPVACEPCRTYKRKCSGGLPCELCAKRYRDRECRYDPGPMSLRVSNVQASTVTRQSESAASVARSSELAHHPKRKSRKDKENTIEKAAATKVPLVETSVEVKLDVEKDQAVISESDEDVGFEFEDDDKAAHHSDHFDGHYHRHSQTYAHSTTFASQPYALNLPPMYTASPQMASYPAFAHMSQPYSQAGALAYSPPSVPYSPSRATMQYSQHSSSINNSSRYNLSGWNNESISAQPRSRSTSGTFVHGYQLDDHFTDRSRPAYPPVSSPSIYEVAYPPLFSSAGFSGTYQPTMIPSREVQARELAVPSPPYHNMSHPMQRSDIKPHQLPAVPNDWQSSLASSQDTTPRPFTSSGVPSIDRRDEAMPKGAIAASFLRCKEKKESEILLANGQDYDRISPLAMSATLDDVDSGDQASTLSEVVEHQGMETAQQYEADNGSKEATQDEAAAFPGMVTMSEAVDSIASESRQVEVESPRRYNTRSRTKA